MKRPTDTTRLALGTDTTSPYTATLQDVLPGSAAQAYTFIAEATATDEDAPPVTAQSVVNIVQAGAAQDADENSLPGMPGPV